MTAKMSQDAKKDEFRKYLEKAGVLELLTKSLVQLYEVILKTILRSVLKYLIQEPEKPSDALSYLKNTVGGSADDKTVIETLKSENDELKAKVCHIFIFTMSRLLNISLVERSGGQPILSPEPGVCFGEGRV